MRENGLFCTKKARIPEVWLEIGESCFLNSMTSNLRAVSGDEFRRFLLAPVIHKLASRVKRTASWWIDR